MIGKQVLAFGKSEKSEFIYIGSFGLSGVTHIWGPNIGRSRRNRVRSHVCSCGNLQISCEMPAINLTGPWTCV